MSSKWTKVLKYVALGVISAAGAVLPEILCDKITRDRAEEFKASTGIDIDAEMEKDE